MLTVLNILNILLSIICKAYNKLYMVYEYIGNNHICVMQIKYFTQYINKKLKYSGWFTQYVYIIYINYINI